MVGGFRQLLEGGGCQSQGWELSHCLFCRTNHEHGQERQGGVWVCLLSALAAAWGWQWVGDTGTSGGCK